MTTSTWLDDYESEAYDDSESDYDSEAYDDSESRRSRSLRRRRALQVAQARQRMGAARAGRVPTPSRPVTPTQAVSAIRNLDLETKVTEDSLRRALEQSNSRARRNTYVTVVSTGLEQALDTFKNDLSEHDFVRAGIRFAPLLLLSTDHRRKGVEGWATDPRVLGAAGIAGVLAVGHFRGKTGAVDSVVIVTSKISKAAGNGKLTAIVLDKNGRRLKDEKVTWEPQGADVLGLTSEGDFNVAKATPGMSVDVLASAGSRTVAKTLEVTA